MDSATIRNTFLQYFADKAHHRADSASLIPHNDPTLYFVNAGMVPFKDVFTGAESVDYSRATSSQRCLRVSGKHNDLDNVGRTPRHHTFFEMLGNFSFGDYFKREAITMAWELLTEVFELDAERLWVTVYEEDDEAYDIWRSIGFPAERLQRLGKKDNFWSMGDVGPCGPCSEIHYDHGEHLDPKGGGPATESDRYVEIWNLVFMQFEVSEKGGPMKPLPRPSIDTGMGLERIAAVKQGVYWNYDTDLFKPLIQLTAELAGVEYGASDEVDTALRVISDHARSAAFLIGDGVMPSNVERGYVLRRVMRRGIRFGVKIGMTEPFFHKVVEAVIAGFEEVYPTLRERASFIHEVVLGEEQRFRRTLATGLKLLDGELEQAHGKLSGDAAFKLSDTYGFPLDLTQQIAEERGATVDTTRYEELLEQQKQMGRAAWKGSGEAAVGQLWQGLAEEHGATEFLGYTEGECSATVLALVKQEGSGDDLQSTLTDELTAAESGLVVLDRTTMYAESGGQVGDQGAVGGRTVTTVSKAAGLHVHHVGPGNAIAVGDTVQASTEANERDKTRRNHTGTHLLHAALRKVLGTHVTQKGSLVGPDRLRFDFAHHKSTKPKELRAIERMVNREILANKPVETTVDNLDAAIEKGAMALFGEKYDDDVRVVAIDGFSVELCGGTHCQRTGDIGLFKIVSEAGIAAGVRRIEAQTGTGALAIIEESEELVRTASALLKTDGARLVESIEKLRADKKALADQLKQIKKDAAKAAAAGMLNEAKDIAGVKVLAASFDGDLREQADRLRDQLGTSVVVLAADRGPKVQLIVAASKDIAGSKVHAGKLIQQLAPMVGGRGGGRPDLAQAGGTDGAAIPAMLAEALALIESALA